MRLQSGRALLSSAPSLSRLPFWPSFLHWWKTGRDAAEDLAEQDPFYSGNAQLSDQHLLAVKSVKLHVSVCVLFATILDHQPEPDVFHERTEMQSPYLDELISMLIFHGGDACLAAGVSLLQQTLPKLVDVLPQIASREPAVEHESRALLNNAVVEQALIHMKQARLFFKFIQSISLNLVEMGSQV